MPVEGSVTNKATTTPLDQIDRIIGQQRSDNTQRLSRHAAPKGDYHVTYKIPRVCQEPTKGIWNIPLI